MSTPDVQTETARVALITGAGAGIGLVTAQLLANQGYRVVVNDLDADAAAFAIASLGEGHLAIAGDVADESAAGRMVEETLARLGRLDALVNNAGISDGAFPALEQSCSRFRRTLDVHVDGTFNVSRAAAKAMIVTGGGAIVNLGSIAGMVAIPGRIAYGAAKSAIAMMTRILACEWASQGIRVNAVVPGYVRTALVENLIRQDKIDAGGIVARTPMGRLAMPQEIASVIAFLLSPAASYITGAALPVDGGYLAFGAPFPASAAVAD